MTPSMDCEPVLGSSDQGHLHTGKNRETVEVVSGTELDETVFSAMNCGGRDKFCLLKTFGGEEAKKRGGEYR